MKSTSKFYRVIILILMAIIFTLFHYPNLVAQQSVITIGRVSDDPKKHYKRLKPFIDYLASRLKHVGIKEGKVILAKDNHAMIKLLREGKIDIVTETPFSSIIYMEKTGAKPILRRWKKGAVSYHSVIFTRKDSGITSLKDLKGKIFAFEDPGSTSGYLLAKTEIMKQGLEMVQLKDFTQKPPPDKVGYLFAGNETNIAHWVHKGLADAGVLSDEEYREPNEVPTGFIADFRTILKTQSVPRSLVLVRANMEPKLEQELKIVLRNMNLSKDGQGLMWRLEKTQAFDDFPGGVEEITKTFKEQYALIQDEIKKFYPE